MDAKIDDIFKPYDETVAEQKLTDDSILNLATSALLAKNSVPFSHRKLANNFTTLRRICQFQIVQPKISMVETSLLNKYLFSTLENSTISQVNKELLKLKEWSISVDDTLREDADELLAIRVKELKHILSNTYTLNSNEINNGYKAIETYLLNITTQSFSSQ